jgi:exopolyphosphatase / guanosine-5'-triphosphate,3'-diphosphate pyrophosphatase
MAWVGRWTGTLLFDIGGGSTEYLVARAGAAVAAVSLRLGVVDLAERYPFPARVDRARYQALQDEVAGRLARELPPAILTTRPARIVGTAGTVTALAAERGALPCLEPGRADLIVPGTAVVLATLATFGAGSLLVSDAALREGVVLQLSSGKA